MNNDMTYQWALPDSLEVPADELQVRLDFFRSRVVMYVIEGGVITTKIVSPRDVALAFLSEVHLGSGLLPHGALWWEQGRDGAAVALWRPPRVWPVALQTEAFQPPRRLRVPMPGLIFICQPGRAPSVYAAKSRPRNLRATIYRAPLFNVFDDGRTCPGTHQYPEDVTRIPESFFTSFFTPTADTFNRSKKYPKDLLLLWEELDGKQRYPLSDLVPMGSLEEWLYK